MAARRTVSCSSQVPSMLASTGTLVVVVVGGRRGRMAALRPNALGTLHKDLEDAMRCLLDYLSDPPDPGPSAAVPWMARWSGTSVIAAPRYPSRPAPCCLVFTTRWHPGARTPAALPGFSQTRRSSRPRSLRHGTRGLADCSPLPRVSWVLLAAGLLVSGLCVLCVLCGSFLLLLEKQNNHREHREHRAEQRRDEQGQRRCGSRRNDTCGACRPS